MYMFIFLLTLLITDQDESICLLLSETIMEQHFISSFSKKLPEGEKEQG